MEIHSHLLMFQMIQHGIIIIRLIQRLSTRFPIDIAMSELDTAIMLTPYEVVFYNGYNPFIPNDTVNYWPTEEFYTFF